MNDLILRSTPKGYASTYFWSFFWMVVVFNFGRWSGSYIGVFDQYDLRYPLSYMGLWGSYVAIVIIAVCLLYAIIYLPLRVNTFHGGENKRWKQVTEISFGFPFSRRQDEIFFDRIIDLTVEQSSIDRLLDTGTLHLKMITFTNGEAAQKSWQIPAVESPFNAKTKILAASPSHEGLEVTIRQPAAT